MSKNACKQTCHNVHTDGSAYIKRSETRDVPSAYHALDQRMPQEHTPQTQKLDRGQELKVMTKEKSGVRHSHRCHRVPRNLIKKC